MISDCFFSLQHIAEYLIFAVWKFLFLFASHTNMADMLTAVWFFLQVRCITLMSSFLVKYLRV